MKKVIFILAISLLVMTGCGGEKLAGNDDFITVDVTKNYLQRKELILQDFMDVEYIKLETKDDFLTQGRVEDVTKDFIIVRNHITDGNIYIFDRNGKGIRKINRLGQGPEEYTQWALAGGIKLDEDNNEILLNSIIPRKIIVYDLSGKYKRSINSDLNEVLFQSQLVKSSYYGSKSISGFETYV